MSTLPPVAKSIFIACKKCQLERFHKVLAHVSAQAIKVQCETCGSTRRHKVEDKTMSEGSSSSVLKASRLKARKKKGDNEAAGPKGPLPLWLELKEHCSADKIGAYDMDARFEANSAFEHLKFGLGFVTVVTSSKIQVVFSEGTKWLVHNLQNARERI